MMLLILFIGFSSAEAAGLTPPPPMPKLEIKSVCEWPLDGPNAHIADKIKAMQKAANCPEKK